MAHKEESNFPQAIYFDTNFFRGLPTHLELAELADLADLSSRFNFKLYIPKIVFDEYFKFLMELVNNKIGDYNTSKKFLERFLTEVKMPEYKFNQNELINNVHANLVMRFKSLGFGFIDTVEIEIKDICTRFFEDTIVYLGDEGFKDVIILETIANHSFSKKLNKIYIVSKDKAFNNPNLKNWFSKKNIELNIINEGETYLNVLENLIKRVDIIVENKGLDRFTQKQNQAREFLDQFKDEIFTFVLKNAKVDKSLSIANQNPLVHTLINEEQLPIFSTILKINSTKFKEFTSVIPHEDEKDNDRYHIDFGVLLEFELTIRQDEYKEPEFSLREFPEGMNFVSRNSSVNIKEVKISRVFFVLATSDLNKSKEGILEDFKLEKVY